MIDKEIVANTMQFCLTLRAIKDKEPWSEEDFLAYNAGMSHLTLVYKALNTELEHNIDTVLKPKLKELLDGQN